MKKLFKVAYIVLIILLINGCKDNLVNPNVGNRLEGSWSTVFEYSGLNEINNIKTNQTAVDTLLSIISFSEKSYSLRVSNLDTLILSSTEGSYSLSNDTLKLYNLNARYRINIKQDTLKINRLVISPKDTVAELYNGMYDFAIVRNYIKN